MSEGSIEGFPKTDSAMLEVKSWRLTSRLRWRKNPWGYHTDELQQMAQCLETGEEKWETVPTISHD